MYVQCTYLQCWDIERWQTWNHIPKDACNPTVFKFSASVHNTALYLTFIPFFWVIQGIFCHDPVMMDKWANYCKTSQPKITADFRFMSSIYRWGHPVTCWSSDVGFIVFGLTRGIGLFATLSISAILLSSVALSLNFGNCSPSQYVILSEIAVLSWGCKKPQSEGYTVLRALSPNIFNFKGCDWLAYAIFAAPFRGDFIDLRKKNATSPVVEAKE